MTRRSDEERELRRTRARPALMSKGVFIGVGVFVTLLLALSLSMHWSEDASDFRHDLGDGFPYSMALVGDPERSLRQPLTQFSFRPEEIDCIVSVIAAEGHLAPPATATTVSWPPSTTTVDLDADVVDEAASACAVDLSTVTFYTD